MPGASWSRSLRLAAITPLIEEMLGDLGEDRVRAALPVLRELRLRLEE